MSILELKAWTSFDRVKVVRSLEMNLRWGRRGIWYVHKRSVEDQRQKAGTHLEKGPVSQIPPGSFLKWQSHNTEAYLMAFERTSKREGWPNKTWADLIGPFLVRPAQQAYLDLPMDPDKEYAVLKKGILAMYGYSLAAKAQRFHDWHKCMTSVK